MDLTITTKNLALSENIEQYARKRLARLDRRLKKSIPVRLMLKRESARAASDRFVAEITARPRGAFLRGEERSSSLFGAIDAASDRIDRQIRRYKARRLRRGDGTGLSEMEAVFSAAFSDNADEPSPGDDSKIVSTLVRTKHHPVTPMSVEDAAVQMELLGHAFFVFLNAESQELNVVYRRSDGDYGLIVPELQDA